MRSRELFTVVAIFAILSDPIETHFTCEGTCYKGYFIEERHVINNKALIGHSFKNLTAHASHQCLSACVSSCRCLAFQIQETRCELLDQNRLLTPHDFQKVQDYKYFDVQQELHRNEDDGSCVNGCCRTNPCLNGGLCSERCDDVTVKFECSCAIGFTGKVCEKMISSCFEYHELESSVQNGIYEISNPSNTGFFNVYCDFTSEPKFVWTLIESFEKIKNSLFDYSFSVDRPTNPNNPQFSEYRLPLGAMTHLLSHSTHFRATCEFNKTFSHRDYLRGNVSSLDLMAVVWPGECVSFERINIRGIECMDCKAQYWSTIDWHGHIESTVDAQWYCPCANCVKWINNLGSEDSFGSYSVINPAHRCVRNDHATTQWWLGVQRSSRQSSLFTSYS